MESGVAWVEGRGFAGGFDIHYKCVNRDQRSLGVHVGL